MFDKTLLDLFQVDSAKATRNGDFLPEIVKVTVKKEWDSAQKCYTDTVKSIVVTSYFYALKKSKIDVVLPANILSEKEVDELNAKTDADEDIMIDFKNLKIGLKIGFNGELQIAATAEDMALM